MAEEHDYEALPESSPMAAHMAAGAVAGIAEHAIMYPFDSIKTRMQVFTSNPSAVYTGITNALSRISTGEGSVALWRGVGSVIVGAGPAHALYFAMYEQCKDQFGGNQGSGHHFIAPAAAGACATTASDALMNPFDVVKQRMQVHGSEYRSVLSCFRSIWAAEGFSAFYVSYPTTLLMTVPFQAMQFSTYEFAGKILNPSGIYDPKSHILAGAMAGSVAAALTTPLDVAKTLLQTRGTSSDPAIRGVRGVGGSVGLIWRRAGVAGFFRGWKPRVLTHMPSTAICWTVYEWAKDWMITDEDTTLSSSSSSTPSSTLSTTTIEDGTRQDIRHEDGVERMGAKESG
ncbi:mitochondrial carrier domain-containing protein [Piptocephalis cylindrospora]|uniref:Mitochondrial carrier domain-containing protein n=1 Tax=Piptocephalis cylindrospora TaxID=1907219 RepID=A0A4P9Y724_9FUNG|nr:mitochondrial carrier domain-containing protein [Piptocephalis cylindrospora]|eukprot:RKP14021.1 mitochondrial carrier domain-containing protein [Piptocephalis cylindrospora]